MLLMIAAEASTMAPEEPAEVQQQQERDKALSSESSNLPAATERAAVNRSEDHSKNYGKNDEKKLKKKSKKQLKKKASS